MVKHSTQNEEHSSIRLNSKWIECWKVIICVRVRVKAVRSDQAVDKTP